MKYANALQICSLRYPWVLILFLQIFIIFVILGEYWTPNWAKNESASIGVWNLKQGECHGNVFQEFVSKCQRLGEVAKGLRTSFLMYSVFLSIFFMFWVLWVVSSVSFVFRKDFYRLGLVAGVGCCVSLATGISVWAILAKVTLNGCKLRTDAYNSEGFCVNSGFYYNAWALLLTVFTQYFFVVIGKVSLKLSQIGFKGAHTLENTESRIQSIDETKAQSYKVEN